MSDEMKNLKKQLKTCGLLNDPAKSIRDSNHLRSIFPEEVWVRILEMVHLLMPQDLENWSNSSPYFRHLLKDKRVTFLFPKVFEILAPYYERHYPVDQTNCYYREDGIVVAGGAPGKSLKYPHKLSAIMRCRLVCRPWNKTIESYYQDPIKAVAGCFSELKYDQMTRERFRRTLEEIELWKTWRFGYFRTFGMHVPKQDPIRFINHFEKTHHLQRNPFITRSISIRMFNSDYNMNMQIMASLMNRILGDYGENVWYCHVFMDVNPIDFRTQAVARGFMQQYQELRCWLLLMPNLRILKINQAIDQDNLKRADPTSEYLSRLVDFIGMFPMSKLEHLEVLGVTNLLGPTFNQLIYQNNHVSGVQMERKNPDEIAFKYDFDFLLASLPNLKLLGIHSFTEEELIKLEEKRDELHLEKFQLTDPKRLPFSWERLISLTKGSSDTLTDLILELPFVENEEGEDLLGMTKCQNLVGHLEKLERVFLFVGRPVFLDWLLPVKNTLKEMKFVIPPDLQTVNEYDKVFKEQTIELFGFEGKMEKSNIWKAFGKLKTVKIGKGYLSDCEEWEEFTRPLTLDG